MAIRRWILASALAAGAVGSVVLSVPAGAALHPIPGTYTVTVSWLNPVDQASYTVTLASDHTLTGSTGDTGTWSTRTSKGTEHITWNIDNGVAIYHGRVTAGGFNTAAHQGKMRNTSGNHGTWYAVSGG